MSDRQRRSPFKTIGRAFRRIVEDELTTPEGKVNCYSLLLAAIVAVLAPLLSGSVLEVSGDANGAWSLRLSLGDGIGALICLVAAGLFCAIIVSGTNFYRRRSEASK